MRRGIEEVKLVGIGREGGEVEVDMMMMGGVEEWCFLGERMEWEGGIFVLWG